MSVVRSVLIGACLSMWLPTLQVEVLLAEIRHRTVIVPTPTLRPPLVEPRYGHAYIHDSQHYVYFYVQFSIHLIYVFQSAGGAAGIHGSCGQSSYGDFLRGGDAHYLNACFGGGKTSIAC